MATTDLYDITPPPAGASGSVFNVDLPYEAAYDVNLSASAQQGYTVHETRLNRAVTAHQRFLETVKKTTSKTNKSYALRVHGPKGRCVVVFELSTGAREACVLKIT